MTKLSATSNAELHSQKQSSRKSRTPSNRTPRLKLSHGLKTRDAYCCGERLIVDDMFDRVELKHMVRFKVRCLVSSMQYQEAINIC
uniref:Uncharacterized protein n=1 Tax=Lotus japonicus TaxID=34305 RepID=I3T792_LOTJA|nr:unknown [Lotus japonicus]